MPHEWQLFHSKKTTSNLEPVQQVRYVRPKEPNKTKGMIEVQAQHEVTTPIDR